MEKTKFELSKALKKMNKEYRRNYTVQDVANEVNVTRESLSRMTNDSSFRLIYNVCECLYNYYPEYCDEFNFTKICLLLTNDDYFWIQ